MYYFTSLESGGMQKHTKKGLEFFAYFFGQCKKVRERNLLNKKGDAFASPFNIITQSSLEADDSKSNLNTD